MKVTMQFELPEDQQQLEAAMKAFDYKHALFDFAEEIRRRTKHVDDCKTDWESVSSVFFDIINERGVELYD